MTKQEHAPIAPCPPRKKKHAEAGEWGGRRREREVEVPSNHGIPGPSGGPRSTPPRTSPKQICERRASFFTPRPARAGELRTVLGHTTPSDKLARGTAQSTTTGEGHTGNADPDRARSSTHPLPLPLLPSTALSFSAAAAGSDGPAASPGTYTGG
jgi:hypothetical protein